MTTASNGPTTGIDSIAQERHRQITKGYTAEHDAQHHDPETLASAALAYLLAGLIPGEARLHWFEPESFHPDPDRGVQLIKAGALIAAAIDAMRAQGQ